MAHVYRILATPKYEPREKEICQCDTDPEALVEATLNIRHRSKHLYAHARFELINNEAGQ